MSSGRDEHLRVRPGNDAHWQRRIHLTVGPRARFSGQRIEVIIAAAVALAVGEKARSKTAQDYDSGLAFSDEGERKVGAALVVGGAKIRLALEEYRDGFPLTFA